MEYSNLDKKYIYQLKKQNVPYRLIQQKLWAKWTSDELRKLRANYRPTTADDLLKSMSNSFYGSVPKSHSKPVPNLYFETVSKEIEKEVDNLVYFHVNSPSAPQTVNAPWSFTDI
jgi:hypothetical protein